MYDEGIFHDYKLRYYDYYYFINETSRRRKRLSDQH